MRIPWGIVITGLLATGCASDRGGGAKPDVAAVGEDTAGESETAYHRPVFSPDGRRILFMRQDPSTDGDWELFTANEDGSGVKRLTTHPGWDGYPAFAPDGQWITFDRDEGKDTQKVSVLMQLATGETRRLGDYEGWLTVNTWSPDGSVLYGFWEKDGQRDIYALTKDGGIIEQITDTSRISEHDVQISRDGASLIFATEKVGGDGSSIDRIELATGSRTTLVESPGRAYGVSISPDGRTLAYNDNALGGDDDAEIYLLDLASGEKRQMTDNDDWDHLPVFHPSGAYLLFTSYRSGHERIYRMEPGDGSVSALQLAD